MLRSMLAALLLVISLFVPAFGQSGTKNEDIRAGWDHFANNELEEAKTSFTKTLKGSDAALGQLGLS
ncbi:MAG: hypothetical protein NWR72_11925, partial [Bacteroidia bacterium]|nr:hypothetical protein [Bacteroidia bacterium]